MDVSGFLKFNSDTYVFQSSKYNRMEFIVDTQFLSEIKGITQIFGVGKIRLYESVTGENETPRILNMNLPIKVPTMESEKIKFNDEQTMLVYYSDTVFINNTKFICDVSNTQTTFDLMKNGKVKGLPYDEMFKLYLSSMDMNGVNLKNPYVIYSLYVAESCRSVKNHNIPHRLDLANGYVTFNARVQAGLSSGNSAALFEDIDTAIVSGIDNTKRDVKSVTSPLYDTMFK